MKNDLKDDLDKDLDLARGAMKEEFKRKTIENKFHYVYIIEHISKKKYIGVRSSIKHPLLDLGIDYFSSSSDTKFIKHQRKNVAEYSYKIINIHPSRSSALNEEVMLHKFFDVANNSEYYNKANQSSVGFMFDRTGLAPWNKGIKTGPLAEEHKKRISLGQIGSKRSEETKHKMSESHKGKKFSEEHKKNMSIAALNRPPASDEVNRKKACPGEKNGMYGKKHSEYSKNKQKNTWKHKPFIKCPHCEVKSKNRGTLTRWHFDNCKEIK